MLGRPFESDDILGLTERFHFDQMENRWGIETISDVQPILDLNKAQANNGDGFTPSRDMKHIARIPLVIVEKWKNELGVDLFNKDHEGKIRQLLNDPDWLYLHTSPGVF